MIIPANARLGRTHDDETIGYAVLTTAREMFTPWAPGTNTAPGWWAAPGVNVPETGGFIAWGREGMPAIAEEAIHPMPDMSGMMMQINNALLILVDRVRAILPAPPPVIVETAHFDSTVATIREQVAESDQRALEQLLSVAETLRALQDMTNSLTVLNDGANQVIALAEMQRRLNGLLGEPTAGLRAVTETTVSPLVTAIDALRGDLGQFTERVSEGKAVEEKRNRLVGAVDALMSRLDGK